MIQNNIKWQHYFTNGEKSSSVVSIPYIISPRNTNTIKQCAIINNYDDNDKVIECNYESLFGIPKVTKLDENVPYDTVMSVIHSIQHVSVYQNISKFSNELLSNIASASFHTGGHSCKELEEVIEDVDVEINSDEDSKYKVIFGYQSINDKLFLLHLVADIEYSFNIHKLASSVVPYDSKEDHIVDTVYTQDILKKSINLIKESVKNEWCLNQVNLPRGHILILQKYED